MQTIRAWLAAHPDEAAAVMARNRSYVFFREAPVDDPALGPIAAAKVPLTAGRSLAVDRLAPQLPHAGVDRDDAARRAAVAGG